MEALVIPAEGKPYLTKVSGGYKQLQELVGGLIDAVSNDYASAYVNDEGLLIGLKFNRIASILMGRYLVGDAVVCGHTDDEGNDLSVPLLAVENASWLYQAMEMHDESLERL